MERLNKRFKHLLTTCSGSCVFLFFILSPIAPIWAEGAGQHGTDESPAISQNEGVKEGDMTDTNRLSEKEGNYLLSVARKTIEEELFTESDTELPDIDPSPKFSEKRGTFVTLTKDGALRGCIGHIIPQESLLEGVKVNSINAAFKDPRFNPLSKGEWGRIKIEVSILTEPKRLEYSDSADLLEKLRPGIDGVILKKGFSQATFLPQVWDQLPDKREFLAHLCLKAGLDASEWKEGMLDVFTYQAQAFEEH
jgi:AmmeMemoRadiSam system protein A